MQCMRPGDNIALRIAGCFVMAPFMISQVKVGNYDYIHFYRCRTILAEDTATHLQYSCNILEYSKHLQMVSAQIKLSGTWETRQHKVRK